ncbi:MAG TPA: hypothetical protein VFC39_17240 [Acidobacteriaceae bacterium]|nr:hypothetical protein [Acidobacteriaceae bacterium]
MIDTTMQDAPLERAPSTLQTPFSLFEGDWLQRAWASVGLGTHTSFPIARRCLLAILATYVPMAVLAWRQGLIDSQMTPTNFFADFAAYAQFLVGLPLFLVAEVIIDGSTREAAEQFTRCGIIRFEDAPRINQVNETLKRLRQSFWPDVACIVLAYVFSLVILVPQFGSHPLPTWHVHGEGHSRNLTAAGYWTFFIAIPFSNYIWMRLIWKIALWIFYLYRVSRMRLELHATHPDLTGGIGFISETQGRFALFILAYGISNVAAPVGYQVAVLNYDLSTLPVWGPLVLFTIGAPLLFTMPLFMFTKQLFRTRKRALLAYLERVTEHSRVVENHWLFGNRPESPQEELRDLAEQSTLGTLFARIDGMRVVPFDLRSFMQLLGSTLGAMATLLPLLHAKDEMAGMVEAISKLLGQLGAH